MSSDSTADITANDILSANDDFDTGLRLGIASSLGQTGFNSTDDDSPRRNLFETFGWPRSDLDNWDEENWVALYLRNGYAKTVNDKPADTSWRDAPVVADQPDSEDTTDFEAAVERLEKNHQLWNYCYRADKAAGLGQHGLLVLGLSDVAGDVNREQWEEDATDQDYTGGLDDLVNLKPVLEMQIEDIEWGGPEDGERWGKPVRYTIDFEDDIDDETEDDQGYRTVHWSRVINIPATPPLDDETLARPRTEPVLNNLLDIEKTLGSVAEAAFMSASQDLHLNSDPTEVDLSEGAEDIRDELMRFFEGQPYLRTQGMDVETLDGDVQDPTGIIEANLDEIASATGIPKSILRGNQSGEVSGSEKDERDWFGVAEERRQQYNTPHIVRAVIDRFRKLALLPEPQQGMYEVSWPDLKQHSEKDIAEIQQTRSGTLANLAQVAPGVARDLADSEYLETGEIPEDEPVDELPEPTEDEMQAQFAQSMDLPSANADVDRTPPQKAQENAQKVLRWREEHPEEINGMTDVGWRRARQLADGGELSEEVIKKMAQFNRHRKNSGVAEEYEGEPWKDAGHVAWLGWGGDAGVDWAINQSDKLTDNATRYSEGDTVDAPDGLGVVVDVRTEPFDGPDGTEVDASEDSPGYVVGLEDADIGARAYSASDLESSELPETVADPLEDVAEENISANTRREILSRIVPSMRANDWSMPESWRESEKPARLILLDAWASMGGQFDCGGACCKGEMMSSGMSDRASDQFCASMKDEVLGGWEGWRRGG